MSVINSDGKRRTRRPSLKGALMQDISNGQERTRSWPKARGKKLNPKTVEQMEWFRTVQLATKYMAPDQLINAMNATAGTPLLPRDILTMMASARLYYFVMEDGRKIASAPMISDVSQSLDIIGQTPGDMMYRADDQWVPLPAGLDGQVLTMVDGIPQWANSGGGGGGIIAACVWSATSGMVASFNVSSIGVATGLYTLNFTTPLDNMNKIFLGGGKFSTFPNVANPIVTPNRKVGAPFNVNQVQYATQDHAGGVFGVDWFYAVVIDPALL